MNNLYFPDPNKVGAENDNRTQWMTPAYSIYWRVHVERGRPERVRCAHRGGGRCGFVTNAILQFANSIRFVSVEIYANRYCGRFVQPMAGVIEQTCGRRPLFDRQTDTGDGLIKTAVQHKKKIINTIRPRIYNYAFRALYRRERPVKRCFQ